MQSVIAIRFRNAGRRQYVLPGEGEYQLGDEVIVPTSQGLEMATVCQALTELPKDKLPQPLYQVSRVATPGDKRQQESNLQKEASAFQICRERIAAHKLDMKLVSVEYTFDNTKLIASFTSNGRVDFRALVKDLAGIFKTRIELKQIGVRDEAKKITGYGSCGRGLCCSTFLHEFNPVSIRMAKEQSLSLNPTKISGVCGRLMCCLKYEQDQYEKSRKRMPRLGKEVLTPQGPGVVTQINALLELVHVRINKGDTADVFIFEADQVQRVQPPQPQGRQQGRQSAKIETLTEPVPESEEEFLGTPYTILDDNNIPDD